MKTILAKLKTQIKHEFRQLRGLNINFCFVIALLAIVQPLAGKVFLSNLSPLNSSFELSFCYFPVVISLLLHASPCQMNMYKNVLLIRSLYIFYLLLCTHWRSGWIRIELSSMNISNSFYFAHFTYQSASFIGCRMYKLIFHA